MGMKLFWKFIICVAFSYTSWHILRYIFENYYHNRRILEVTARCSKMVFILLISHLWLISYCVCQRPSWKPKTQPNGSSAVVWLSFWFSTRFTRKTLDYSNGSCLYTTKYSNWGNIILKSVPSDGENRVRRRSVELLAFNTTSGRWLTN